MNTAETRRLKEISETSMEVQVIDQEVVRHLKQIAALHNRRRELMYEIQRMIHGSGDRQLSLF